MRPLSCVPSVELDEWGNEDVQRLVNHYGQTQTHTFLDENKDEHKVTSLPILCPEDVMSEWVMLKETVLKEQYPRDNTAVLWGLIARYHKESFPEMIKLAHLALSSPVHTADCERGFSAQNRLLTSLRNRLSPENQDMLLRVKLHTEPIDYTSALEAWEKAKNRRSASQ